MYEKAKETAVVSKRLAAEISWIRGGPGRIIRLGSFTHTRTSWDSALFYEREAISIGIIKAIRCFLISICSALAESYALYKQQDPGTCQPELWLSSDEAKTIPQRPFCKAVLTDAIRFSSDLAQPRLPIIRASN